jgi:hypothetical protein
MSSWQLNHVLLLLLLLLLLQHLLRMAAPVGTASGRGQSS